VLFSSVLFLSGAGAWATPFFLATPLATSNGEKIKTETEAKFFSSNLFFFYLGDKVLGPRKDSWCEFHEAFGHHIDNCLSLGYQLDELVRSEFLKDYVAEPARTAALPAPAEEQAHEMLVLDEVHTIDGGFSDGGPTASQRKK